MGGAARGPARAPESPQPHACTRQVALEVHCSCARATDATISSVCSPPDAALRQPWCLLERGCLYPISLCSPVLQSLSRPMPKVLAYSYLAYVITSHPTVVQKNKRTAVITPPPPPPSSASASRVLPPATQPPPPVTPRNAATRGGHTAQCSHPRRSHRARQVQRMRQLDRALQPPLALGHTPLGDHTTGGHTARGRSSACGSLTC